jgi:hypothetical protein
MGYGHDLRVPGFLGSFSRKDVGFFVARSSFVALYLYHVYRPSPQPADHVSDVPGDCLARACPSVAVQIHNTYVGRETPIVPFILHVAHIPIQGEGRKTRVKSINRSIK